METFTFNTVELILLSVAGILFIIQLIYYFGLYNRIHVHNKAVGKEEVLSLIHISEPTRRTPISYAVFCLKKKKKKNTTTSETL